LATPFFHESVTNPARARREDNKPFTLLNGLIVIGLHIAALALLFGVFWLIG